MEPRERQEKMSSSLPEQGEQGHADGPAVGKSRTAATNSQAPHLERRQALEAAITLLLATERLLVPLMPPSSQGEQANDQQWQHWCEAQHGVFTALQMLRAELAASPTAANLPQALDAERGTFLYAC